MADMTIYLNASTGSDANDGLTTGNPKKTFTGVAGALSVLPNPVEGIYTIKLQGASGAANDWTSLDDEIVLDGLVPDEGSDALAAFVDTAIIIEPENWSQSQYGNNQSPIDTAGTDFDPEQDRYNTIPPISADECRVEIKIRGVKIAPSATVDGEGVDFEGVNAEFDYCEITGFSFGIKHVTASMDVRNCYIHDNSGVGIFSLFGLMKIAGDNFIADNYYAGILASGSDIFIQPFEDNPELQFTTTIQTSKALKKYAAIRLNLGAKVSVGRHHPFIPEDLALLTGESGAAAEAQLRILNNNAYRSPNYYGVQLESVSTFIGTANTSFTKTVTAGSGVGLDTTVEPAQQFVTNEGEGCQLLK